MERLKESGSEKRRDFLKQFTGGMVGLAAGMGLPEISEAQYTPGAGLQAKREKVIIDRVETIKVIVPPRKNIINSAKIGDDGTSSFWKGYKSIIKLYGDNGFIGLGETFRYYNEDEFEKNKQFLKGKDVFSLNFAHRSLGMPFSSSVDAFEMAIFDLVGKTLGVPVYQLLGGKHQDKVAVGYWTGRQTGEDMQNVARKAWEMGYKGFKYKQRPGDSMVEQVKDITKGAPGIKIVIDPNNHFKDYDVFIRQAKQLEGYNIQCLENPMPLDIDTYVRLSEELQKINIPLCIHTSDIRIITEAIKVGACQIFNISGDMRSFVQLCHLIDAFGFICWHGSSNDIGVQDASYVHAIAATSNCVIPSDVLGYLIRQDDLLSKTFTVKDAFAIVPDDPGLGVELDEDAVKKYSV